MRVFLSPPHMGRAELKYVKEVFKSNYIAPLGAFVDSFEERVKAFTGAPHAVALSSGTAAIHLALKVLGVKPGDEIIASTFTFIGSVAPVLYEKCKPVFVESDDASWNMSPEFLQELLEKKRRAGKLPKAIILTHLYGQCADAPAIAAIAKKYGLFLIEDAAEALGAVCANGAHAGTVGDIGVYSFNGNKIITTSGGGMLVTANKTYAERARFYATQAREKVLHYEHKEVGYNYRLSNVLGAIGCGQMETLAAKVAKKRRIFSWYEKLLDLEFMPEIKGSVGNRWLTCGLFKKQEQKTRAIEILAQNGIESRPLWKPMHLQAVFRGAEYFGDGFSENAFKKGICLPSGTALRRKDVVEITDLIKENNGSL